MKDKKCVECGKTLNSWNRSKDKSYCLTCYADKFTYRFQEFFDSEQLSEEDLNNRGFATSLKTSLLIGLVVNIGWALGALTLGWWIGGSLGLILAGLVAVRPMVKKITHPLDRLRLNNFLLPMIISLAFMFIFYLFRSMALAFSSESYSPSRAILNALFSTYLSSNAIGLVFALLFDKRAKSRYVSQFKKWQQKRKQVTSKTKK
jgi:hypothetical protein